MLSSALTTMRMGELPGFSLHLITTAKIKSFDEMFEENVTWLQEVLEDAKKQFGREEMAMFPKTPVLRRRRQRIRRVSTIHNEDIDCQLPKKNKRSSRASILGKACQSRQSTVPLRRSARNSARSTITAQNGTSRTRTSKKVQIHENTVEPVQGLNSSDTSSCSDDVDTTKKAALKDEPKRSSDSSVITTTEAPMDTEECGNQATRAYDTVAIKSDDPSIGKNIKRNAVSKTKKGSKKLRLNSGEAVSTVSDSSISDEYETKSKAQLQMVKENSSSIALKGTEQKEETLTRPGSTATSKTERPKRKNAASRYKDHVKRLISHHEHLIAEQVTSSDDEFQSPKHKQVVREAVQKAKQPVPAKKNKRKNVKEEVNQDAPEKPECISEEKSDDEVFDNENAVNNSKSKKEESPEKMQEQPSSLPSPIVPEQESIPETVKSDEGTAVKDVDSVESIKLRFSESEDENQQQDSQDEHTDDVRMEGDEQSVAEDSLDQRSIAEDSLNKVNTPDNSPKQLQEASPKPADMTTDSLDQQNMTEDSLNHNDMSCDSLNQSTSKARMTRQSLRKNLSLSTRRSSVAVSCSKKRSSVYRHRTSIRKSLHHSVRNPCSTRASTRASTRRATVEQVLQESIETSSQDVMEEVLPEEDAPVSPNDKEATPPKRMSTHPPTINQETQRITRAASRIAENQKSSLEKQDEVSDSPKSMDSTPDNQSHDNSCSSDDFVSKTPSPKCPANKVVRPRATFLSSGKKEPRYLNNLHGMVSSFIKRNTPQKQTATERQQEIKKNILNKQRRDEEIRRKLEAEKQKQRELQKRKREERIKKVTEARERRAAIQEQKRQEMEQKQLQMSRQTTKKIEDKKQEEILRKQLQIKKKAEAEERRRQEERVRMMKIKEQEEEQRQHQEMIQRKKEFEEQERQRRIDEARRQQEQRRGEMERQRLEELQRRRDAELAKEREMELLKEERERERKAEMERKREQERWAREEALEKERRIEAERLAREKERQQDQKHLAEIMQQERERRELERQKEQAEHDRLKASILKHNTSACLNTSSCLNTTVTKDTSPTSYDMTPRRVPLPSTSDNYNIDDLESGDSTDEEDSPRKTIPSWAQGAGLKAALIKQFYHPPPNLDTMFGPLLPPDLSIIFAKKRSRYLKRTSSAVWDSPLLKA
ncbi:inner centromere protein A-like [Acanthaster planci]|uniref:Inner centromere protein A-like n=1 Tax=Acanthaster planci TaxID=133434 RepID=A0A8B7ZB16_ACAPL|nr:inner centromere protein A-like [Acanthaster planci]XP_022102010.1 inner centromere protein A-like [Acanthaster planci]